MTERTLVQAAQSGRSEATDELVERYYPRVYSFVATLQSGEAEDLTQEVFARALGALPRFNGEYQFGAWLLQIARNVCIDEARRQVRRPQPTDPVDLVELETSDSLPDHVWESVSSQIAVATVHRALARLPKRQRTVLMLRELEGMSYADIAVALRISTRAVEISLSRARKRMRLGLKDLDLAERERGSCPVRGGERCRRGPGSRRSEPRSPSPPPSRRDPWPPRPPPSRSSPPTPPYPSPFPPPCRRSQRPIPARRPPRAGTAAPARTRA